jgi:hypothetical protein
LPHDQPAFDDAIPDSESVGFRCGKLCDVSARGTERAEFEEDYMASTWRNRLIAIYLIAFSVPSAAWADKIAICHAGIVTLVSFRQHVKTLRGSPRDSPGDLDELIARAGKGGSDFFTSQIIVQEEPSGSGTFDLRRIHGLLSAKYRNVTAWACEPDDYPIVYFVGFRVRKIEDRTISVSREKDIVNVISLHALDPDLDKRLRVTLTDHDEILCEDLGKTCIDRIFYDRY